MNRERNEQFMRARFDLSQDDQTCMFSEQAHHLELANRDEQEGEECVSIPGFVIGLVVGTGFALALLIIVVSNLPRWFS